MANLAQIQSIAQGQFFVKDSLGNLVELKVGDTVSLNDIIVAASSNTDLSKIEILFDTNELIILSQGEQLLDTTLLASTFGNEELAFDKQEVDETLNAWNNAQDGDETDMETAAGDVTEQATNAGDENAQDGGALRSKFNLRDGFNSRDGDATDIVSDLREASFGGENTEEPQEQIPTELLNPAPVAGGTPAVPETGEAPTEPTPTEPTPTEPTPTEPTPTEPTPTEPTPTEPTPTEPTPTIPVDTRVPASVITLSDPIVKEGEGITIIATVTNPPQTDLIITLSNGKTTQTITISAGETTGSVTFDNPNGEDVYIDNSTETYTITGTTGGNYVSLDTSDSSVVTIEDTETPVTVDLTASIVNEDASDTSYVFTATLSEKSQGVTTIVTDKGTIEITDGQTTGTLVIASNNKGDVYVDASELTATISSASGGNFEKINIGNATATAKVTDTITPIDVTITATVTTPKIIDVNTKLDGSTGVKVTGYNSDGIETNLSVIKGTNHDGFGVAGKNLSNGDTKELGLGEKIVVEFKDGKDVNSLDVSFAWRNNNETAKLTFIKDDKAVGYATVDGDGKSTTKAIVKYFDTNDVLIKEVNAKGSSDKVDEAFTFELPSSKESGADLVSFDKVEFSAPKSKDDYLINKIVYKEVLNTEVTDIVTNGGNVTFNIQVDEKYPPQGKATATVEVGGETYQVELNATGRGTLTIDSKELGTDLSNVEAKVTEVKGGNYEGVKSTQANFDFTPEVDKPTSSDDIIYVEEDDSYTLTINDFGDISESTTEFKITEVPTNGKLTLSVTTVTIVDNGVNQTTVTQDSKVEITKNQIVTLGQVGAGKVEFVPNKDTDNDGSFKFQVGDGEKFSKTEYETEIIVNAVAPDLSDASTDGSEAVSNVMSFAGGGDIYLSNLKDIVNLKEINLENGQKNDITDLKLDDVLKLSSDDGKIKITGDEIDSVTLKNEEGETWQEGSPVTEDSKTLQEGSPVTEDSKTLQEGSPVTEDSKTFETYTNSGDSTVQVKVEQPISDGITS
ncbi:hypothetical protein NG767_02385 [Aliarcobacter cryaerophilus]|uniref:immunoglobulin-like domain-containing protein n=1 Tax=Aliarcobacter cryaerophilus TaxID=28198 RepID=UPI003DA2B1C0